MLSVRESERETGAELEDPYASIPILEKGIAGRGPGTGRIP